VSLTTSLLLLVALVLCVLCGGTKTALDRINLGLPSSTHDATGNRGACLTEKRLINPVKIKRIELVATCFMCASKFSIIYGRRSEDFFLPLLLEARNSSKRALVGWKEDLNEKTLPERAA
jgi:hypothetical protein